MAKLYYFHTMEYDRTKILQSKWNYVILNKNTPKQRPIHVIKFILSSTIGKQINMYINKLYNGMYINNYKN